MTEEETLKIMSVLRASYPNFYKDMKRSEADRIVALWTEMFADDDYKLVAVAVKSFIGSDDKGFPPNIGQVRGKMRLLTEKEDMTESEAWALVLQAIKNGIYGYREEYEKLPEIVQRCVGAATQIHDWALMDSEIIHSVVASNFQRSFRAKQKSNKEYAALPSDVKKMLGEVMDKFSIGDGT